MIGTYQLNISFAHIHTPRPSISAMNIFNKRSFQLSHDMAPELENEDEGAPEVQGPDPGAVLQIKDQQKTGVGTQKVLMSRARFY